MKKAPLSQPTEPPSTNGMKTMTAIVQDEYGTAPEQVLRLAEIARPAMADDEIFIHVRATSVDRGTWHLMAGLAYPMRLAAFGLRAPKARNPGRSLAGTVQSAGTNVTEFKPGDDVCGTCDGSFAPCARAQAGTARGQAGEPVLRAGGGRPCVRADRLAGRASREGAGRAEGADHRRRARIATRSARLDW